MWTPKTLEMDPTKKRAVEGRDGDKSDSFAVAGSISTRRRMASPARTRILALRHDFGFARCPCTWESAPCVSTHDEGGRTRCRESANMCWQDQKICAWGGWVERGGEGGREGRMSHTKIFRPQTSQCRDGRRKFSQIKPIACRQNDMLCHKKRITTTVESETRKNSLPKVISNSSCATHHVSSSYPTDQDIAQLSTPARHPQLPCPKVSEDGPHVKFDMGLTLYTVT